MDIIRKTIEEEYKLRNLSFDILTKKYYIWDGSIKSEIDGIDDIDWGKIHQITLINEIDGRLSYISHSIYSIIYDRLQRVFKDILIHHRDWDNLVDDDIRESGFDDLFKSKKSETSLNLDINYFESSVQNIIDTKPDCIFCGGYELYLDDVEDVNNIEDVENDDLYY